MEDFKHDDITSVGHLMLRQQRQTLKYLRLIEMEVPLLAAFRKPVHPVPLSQSPISIRTLSYGGEPHPATNKAVIVAPVSYLPLKSPSAIHKFKLLAGPRWTTDVPRDAGFSGRVKDGEGVAHGFIKISHEAFPLASMNAKWCSDTLEKLIEEANKDSDAFAEMPISHRHIEARVMRQRRGDHRITPGPRSWKKTTIKDIPRRWL
ncbi:mitochondrial ribosomal subunit protein-domain-containing protein [Cantharellus anzutake]|uniref:mitochondrial ribosomal subunit protein-domain-containing protein n=1 Tax=Cantharellus anzutake TaxID=1750568 RepID=UPI0019083ADD|nr:mitochondrial ribosomal subunit protein-domain-containing protein [Cantharellus anzutake]KAF8342650.1 mitochondrial ribosomal subunit protein-domain-containing protein [Cantharellus anzutake]